MFGTYKRKTKPLLFHISTIVLFFLLTIISSYSHAENNPNNDHITFTKPWIRLLPPTVMSTAGYVEINNSSTVADKLLSVWSPTINGVSVHQTKEVDGLLKMLEADNTTIPPNGKLILQPGGYHLMLMGIKKPLVENETVTIHFEFERAGIVHVNFPVLKK
ncbi:copper chaperone PCu(A)C [Colwellia sp. RE-S-Sl-9]